MFEKSKSEITFKEFQHKLNILHNFEDDWGHFCDPEDDTNNNIFYNNLYKSIKKVKEVKVKEEKVVQKEEKVVQKVVEKEEKVVEKLNQNYKYENEYKNYEYENDDIKKYYIIDTVFNCISVIFITFVSFKITHLTGIN